MREFKEDEVMVYRMEDAIRDIKDTLLAQNNEEIVNRKQVIMSAGKNTMIMNFPALHIKKGYSNTKIMSINDGISKAHSILTDINTGEVVASIAASYLTELRTGAMSAIATDLLSRKGASTLGIIGTGRMALEQAVGVITVRNIEKVILFNRHKDKAESFKIKLEDTGYKGDIEIVEDVNTLTKQSDIINTATPATEAVFNDEYVKRGAHINGIGSFMPSTKEMNTDTIARAKYVLVDYKNGVEKSAGEFITAEKEGKFKFEDMIQLNEALNQDFTREDEDITIFKSVGTSLYDMAVAIGAYEMLK